MDAADEKLPKLKEHISEYRYHGKEAMAKTCENVVRDCERMVAVGNAFFKEDSAAMWSAIQAVPGLVDSTQDPDLMGGEDKAFTMTRGLVKCSKEWSDYEEISQVGDNFTTYTNVKETKGPDFVNF